MVNDGRGGCVRFGSIQVREEFAGDANLVDINCIIYLDSKSLTYDNECVGKQKQAEAKGLGAYLWERLLELIWARRIAAWR